MARKVWAPPKYTPGIPRNIDDKDVARGRQFTGSLPMPRGRLGLT